MILRTGTRKNYRIWFLPTSGISSCGISQGKIISVNWLLCYRSFEAFKWFRSETLPETCRDYSWRFRPPCVEYLCDTWGSQDSLPHSCTSHRDAHGARRRCARTATAPCRSRSCTGNICTPAGFHYGCATMWQRILWSSSITKILDTRRSETSAVISASFRQCFGSESFEGFKRPVYILAFGVYNYKQVNVSGIQHYLAQMFSFITHTFFQGFLCDRNTFTFFYFCLNL